MLVIQVHAEHFNRIEVQFRINCALDTVTLSKSMIFAREKKISDRYSLATQDGYHLSGLVWRHDQVFVALEENNWFGQQPRVKKR